MEASNKFMERAGTEVLPKVQGVLAQIEALLDTTDESIAGRLRSILLEAQSRARRPVNPLGYGELSSLLMRLKGHLSVRMVARPTIFVGYRYTEQDEELAKRFIEIIRLEGFNPISGKTAKAEDIDEKVKRMIETSEGVIIIFTKEKELKEGGWTTSTWLTDEKSYALGQGKRVGLFFEDRIAPSQKKRIHGDLEYIEFNCEHLEEAFLQAIPYLRDFRQRILESITHQ